MTTPEPDLCVCGAHMAEQLLPMLREASAAFAEVRQVIPTLAEVNRRLAVLERRGPDVIARMNAKALQALSQGTPLNRESEDWLSVNDDHVHVFVEGFDRCSWCGVER